MPPRNPSYKDCAPASEQASRTAKATSRKVDTRCEVKLRKALWHRGFRYRKNVSTLPGKPDIVFPSRRVVVFCDGDFWHGRDWENRKAKLQRGSNPDYWIAKIRRNRERDQENVHKLEMAGWTALRFWESDIHQRLDFVVDQISNSLAKVSEFDENT